MLINYFHFLMIGNYFFTILGLLKAIFNKYALLMGNITKIILLLSLNPRSAIYAGRLKPAVIF